MYFKEKNINDIFNEIRKEENNYFFDLANLESKYFKLYIYSNIKVYQQKRIATKLKLLDICKKINKN